MASRQTIPILAVVTNTQVYHNLTTKAKMPETVGTDEKFLRMIAR